MTSARPKVWITRSQPSAEETAAALQAAGFTAIAAPLLKVTPLKTPKALPPINSEQSHEKSEQNLGLIFTSQNGVRAFCAAHTARGYPVYAVGDATAALALKMEFTQVSSAGGSADDIAPLIARLPNVPAKFLHISGQHVRGSVSADVQALGFSCERRIYYRSAAVDALPDIDIAQMDAAVLMSPLAARTLAQLSPDTSKLALVSLSPAVDAALGVLPCKNRAIAERPTLQSLIAALRCAV